MNAMYIRLNRLKENNDSTIGIMFVDSKFETFTVEDEGRDVKIKGETRIPEGIYEIKFREVISPKTQKYRAKFPWFTWHLELQDVPNFQYVYIHIGNDDDDSDGCILVGADCFSEEMVIGKSVLAFSRLYNKVKTVLESGNKVFIQIKDIPA